VLASVAGHAEEPCPSVAHGNQRLALALADELGAAVRLRSAVDRVVWGSGGVRVRAAGAEVDADDLVLAVPASVIDRIMFEPALPERVSEAYASVEYGHAVKLFAPLNGVPSPSAVLSVPERYWTWTATGAAGLVQPVVHAFAGSAPALAALRVEDGPEIWLDSLARLRPELAFDPAGAVLSTWDDDPWVEAAYSTHGSEPAHGEGWAPSGPLHFCGEHTAGDRAATMEGALRSGLRAADELLRHL
jgi:monoamine oxidase